MIFNGVNLNHWFLIQRKERDLLPPQEIIRRSIPGRAGSIYVRKKENERIYPIQFFVWEHTKKSLRSKIHEIAQILDVNKPVPIKFLDDPKLTFYGMPVGETSITETLTVGEGTIEFLFPSPYGYEEEKSVIVNVAGDPNITIPRTGAGSESPLIRGIPVPIKPTFEIEFEESANEISITNESTGETFRVVHNFHSGDRLVCNFRNRRIELNGTLNQNIWDYTTKRWSLQPGDNQISVSPDVAKVTIKYRPAWK